MGNVLGRRQEGPATSRDPLPKEAIVDTPPNDIKPVQTRSVPTDAEEAKPAETKQAQGQPPAGMRKLADGPLK